MAELLYKCMTKATTAEGDQLKYGPNWAFSRRAILKVYEDHLTCGDWRIDYESIEDAVLYSLRSLLFIPGYVLRVETAERTYHFGLNGWGFWRRDLPFPVRREHAKLGYTLSSIVVRVVFLSVFAWWVWNKWIAPG